MTGKSQESSEASLHNQTGLPDDLKTGVENLSGYSLDDVRVHYNSPKPAQLQALAYTQGTDIHVAPGQEEHLTHEAWHVVQQMQGKVKPTIQAQGMSINNDQGLEHEADVMGLKALQRREGDRQFGQIRPTATVVQQRSLGHEVIQGQWEQILYSLLVGGATLGVLAAYSWWPAGWGLAQLRNLSQYVALRDILSWANLAWTPGNVINLAQAYAADAGGRTAADWVAIAGAVGATDHEANVATFARMPAWNPVNITALLALFKANPGGRTAADWVAIAGAVGATDHEANVATFARMPAWNPVNITALLALFKANPGGRTADDWVTIAGAVGATDHQRNVAAFARMPAWNPVNITALLASFKANAGGRTADDWVTIAGAVGAKNHEANVAAFARMPGWKRANITALLASFKANPGGRTADDWVTIAGAVGAKNHEANVAAFARMPGWKRANIIALLALFEANAGGRTAADWVAIAGARGAKNDEANVATFAQMPAWNPTNITALLALFKANAGRRTAANWVAIATAVGATDHEANVAAFTRMPAWNLANITALLALFEANAGGRTAADWVAIGRANQALVDQEVAVSELGRMAGWLSANIPPFADNAINAGLTVGNLQAFLRTVNAVPNSLALVGAWGANVVGQTVGTILTAGGAPTNPELVQLLGFANVHNWAAVNLTNAAGGAICGVPNWGATLPHANTFATNWVRPVWPAGMGGTVVATNLFPGPRPGIGGYQVQLRLLQQRINHVANGHSFDNFDMTYANCIRNGVGGNITLYPVGTNITATVTAHVNSVPGQNLADQVASTYPLNGVDPGKFLQNNMVGDRVGIQSDGNRFGPGGGTYPTALTQCYPLPGGASIVVIVGRDLVAIGRLMGQIP
ncbi:MAG: DUF4157 domain-containing protein [Moorea sp. SIO4G3]|nr:DUF4157 domain-containing protein [Moorena sp. SIO4G3]